MIPALNEAASIERAIASSAGAIECVVVDGGSSDETRALAERAGARVIEGPRGRGLQQNVGAASACGEVVVFLHADTTLPARWASEIARLLRDPSSVWGRFDVRFDEAGPLLALIAWLISRRSRATGIATGDQAIFVRRGAFLAGGGFAEPLLFEDIEFSRRMKREGRRPVCPAQPVVTSSRRWREGGTWKTVFLMWSLKLAYYAGVPAEKLAAFYRSVR